MGDQNQNRYDRGWWDTNAHFADILKADEFLTKLVFRHLNVELLTNAKTDIITAAVTIFCNARYPAHNRAVRPKEYVESLVIGELMAPVLPTRLTLQNAHARIEFERVMTYLVSNPTVYTRGRTIDTWIDELTEANAELEEEHQMAVPNPGNLTFNDYVDYLIWLAIKLPVSQYMTPVGLVVTSYIGVAKRGTLSERYITKVVDGIRDDLGLNITLEPETVKAAYVNFGHYVKSLNARDVFTRWLSSIPQHALRLRLCLEQVAGSGLTAFIVVGKAYRKFSDFPWDRLNILTEGEMDKYIVAVRTVNGNPYYGFNRDLGPARSTLYSSVAYVAKELLIRISGETSLTKYQGWIKRPKNPTAVELLISNYVTVATDRMNTAVEGPPNGEAMNQYNEAINNEVNDEMFA